MTRPSDHGALDLWQFHLDAVFGRAQGRVIWQPRILAWFTDKRFFGQPLPAPYTAMSEPEVYRSLGCSNRIYEYNTCFKWVDPADVRRWDEQVDEAHILHVIDTPHGRLTELVRKSPNSWYLIEEKWWIDTPEDMRVYTWLLDHSTWRWDQATFDDVRSQWGRLGAPTMFMPRVTVQDLYIDKMGVERGIFALYEWDAIDDYFRALNENQYRLIEVINASPVEIINFGDNLHCETLSPRLFEKYVLPVYHERTRRLHTAGKFVHSHWDGKVKALLKYARQCGLDGIEAITPRPQGDVTLEETKEALGDEVYLLDGIPAVYFDTTFSEEVLAECTERVIKLFAPKLILGISDEISSNGEIERVRLVGKIVDDYNARIAPVPAME
jgi:Uroporphyrinogen decarboxylase (URO-D)